MKTYARIQDARVAELFATDGDITSMFNPALVWVDISSRPDIVEGWTYDGAAFAPPPAPPPTASGPTIAQLQAQIAALSAQLATLAAKD
jgi:hypothetical protein